MEYRYKITVRINGTENNRWHFLGLKQNPFPSIAKAEWMNGELALLSLDGDPVKSPDDIRDRLKDKVSEELINLCIAQFKPGQIVSFDIGFND